MLKNTEEVSRPLEIADRLPHSDNSAGRHVINIHMPNNGASKQTKQELKEPKVKNRREILNTSFLTGTADPKGGRYISNVHSTINHLV